jgi:hypothetical protein
MPVIADYSDEIIALAARQYNPGQEFQRVVNYAHIQQTYCVWGLVPGSVTDESSPFNECSHAYLAATKDVLRRMTAMPQHDPRVDDLARRMDADTETGLARGSGSPEKSCYIPAVGLCLLEYRRSCPSRPARAKGPDGALIAPRDQKPRSSSSFAAEVPVAFGPASASGEGAVPAQSSSARISHKAMRDQAHDLSRPST